MLCDYGCNQEFLFEFKNKKKCCSKDFDSCPAVKERKSKIIKNDWVLRKNNPEEYLKKPKRKTLLPIAEELDCDYGCGKPFQFTLKNEKKCCSSNSQSCEVIKKKNSLGGKLSYLSGERLSATERYLLLNDDQKLRMSRKGILKYSIDEVFKLHKKKSAKTKKYILHFNLKEYKCEFCSIKDIWKEEKIILELDHIDGNNKNDELNNLRFLCLNCHSQTITYRNRKKNFTLNSLIDKLNILKNKNIKRFKINNIFQNGIYFNGTTLKQHLIFYELIKYCCNKCDIDYIWNNKPIMLELDHIDGNNKNNDLINLRLLCPNCHSQTSTFKNITR